MPRIDRASGRERKIDVRLVRSGAKGLVHGERRSGWPAGSQAIRKLTAAPRIDKPKRITPIHNSFLWKVYMSKPPATVPKMLARKVGDSRIPLPRGRVWVG